MRWAIALGLILTMAAGCSQWDGDASITLSNGSVLRCSGGLHMNVNGVMCRQTNAVGERVPWGLVAGYSAGLAR